MSTPPRMDDDATAYEPPPAVLRHVQLTVCDHAHDVDDARRLLQMLDLIEQPYD